VVGTVGATEVVEDEAGGFCVGLAVLLGWFVVPASVLELALSVVEADEEDDC
jgi:hypothetical protein